MRRLYVLVGALFAAAAVVSSLVPLATLQQRGLEFWYLIAPGGALHPAVFLEHKGHLLIETLLLIAILYLLLLPRTKPKHKESLTEQEVDELCAEWAPEPLVPAEFDSESYEDDLVIESKIDKYVEVNGEAFLNMESTDFLGLLTEPDIQEACQECIEQYGVGSCGPRAFYGTTEAHLKLEKHIATFMGTQESIVYSFDIATVPSVLPAFANRKDIIVVDERVHYPIQSGCRLSRAQIHLFKHNDMADLEKVLQDIDLKHKAAKKPLNRRFIVVEGIYHLSGDVAPLDEVYRLKSKYKYRLVVDESLSLGVLGQTGRGACQEFGLRPDQVDIVTASLSNALASVGGFCAGDHDIIGHQRLNGYGYIFSASLPPYLASAADLALTKLELNSAKRDVLRDNTIFMRNLLQTMSGIQLFSTTHAKDTLSPILQLCFPENAEIDYNEAKRKLKDISRRLRNVWNILVSVPDSTGLEWEAPKPTLKIAVTVKHTKEELTVVNQACQSIVQASV